MAHSIPPNNQFYTPFAPLCCDEDLGGRTPHQDDPALDASTHSPVNTWRTVDGGTGTIVFYVCCKTSASILCTYKGAGFDDVLIFADGGTYIDACSDATSPCTIAFNMEPTACSGSRVDISWSGDWEIVLTL